jgi:hypothetical protein
MLRLSTLLIALIFAITSVHPVLAQPKSEPAAKSDNNDRPILTPRRGDDITDEEIDTKPRKLPCAIGRGGHRR